MEEKAPEGPASGCAPLMYGGGSWAQSLPAAVRGPGRRSEGSCESFCYCGQRGKVVDTALLSKCCVASELFATQYLLGDLALCGSESAE